MSRFRTEIICFLFSTCLFQYEIYHGFLLITGGVRERLAWNSRLTCSEPTSMATVRRGCVHCWPRTHHSVGRTAARRGTGCWCRCSSATGSGLAIWPTWSAGSSSVPRPRVQNRLSLRYGTCIVSSENILNVTKRHAYTFKSTKMTNLNY